MLLRDLLALQTFGCSARLVKLVRLPLKKHVEFDQIIGIVAGCCTSAASLPQIVTTIKKKKADDVSPFMFFVLLAGNALWLYYGVRRSDVPIWATNGVSVILDLVMLYLRFKYRASKNVES